MAHSSCGDRLQPTTTRKLRRIERRNKITTSKFTDIKEGKKTKLWSFINTNKLKQNRTTEYKQKILFPIMTIVPGLKTTEECCWCWWYSKFESSRAFDADEI
jgi:hypothetical protein